MADLLLISEKVMVVATALERLLSHVPTWN